MTVRRLTISEDLAQALEVLADSHGGLVSALEHLVNEAVDQTAQTGKKSTASITGKTHRAKELVFMLQLRKGDLVRLDEESSKTGLTQSQWIAALVRQRLNQRPQFSPIERRSLKAMNGMLRKIEGNVEKIARVIKRPDVILENLPKNLEDLEYIRNRVSSLTAEIRDVLRVSDSYWSGTDLSHDRKDKGAA